MTKAYVYELDEISIGCIVALYDTYGGKVCYPVDGDNKTVVIEDE